MTGVASALDREAHDEGEGDFIGDDGVFEGDDDDDDLAGDGREKLRATSDPKSEVTLSYQHRLGEQLRVGFYGIAGFSDASPDWGVGASLTYRF